MLIYMRALDHLSRLVTLEDVSAALGWPEAKVRALLKESDVKPMRVGLHGASAYHFAEIWAVVPEACSYALRSRAFLHPIDESILRGHGLEHFVTPPILSTPVTMDDFIPVVWRK